MPITAVDVHEARRRIRGGVLETPCPESVPLSEIAGCRVFCKLDYLQRTGSFKERGARNALLCLNDEQRARGVVAASAGNHALGLTYHGRQLGIPVTVVMPKFAPLIKVSTCRRLGAEVVLHGETFADARARADQLVAERGLTYINGYDDPAIIAGQGTLGLEILEQVPDVDAVIVPVGGGGLLAGIALAIKSIKPSVRIISTEARNVASWQAALDAGKPVPMTMLPSLADGLAVPMAGVNAFAVAQGRVDRHVLVGEDQIALAILRVLELEKGVVEGAAASTLAALLSGQLPELAGKTVVLPFCGGNVDPNVLSRVISKGLAADGRLCRFVTRISDRPGGLARFASTVASAGAGIVDVTHDRAFSGPDVSAVDVICTAETEDRAHVERLFTALRTTGFETRAI
jgi:threonine dehydratase